MNDPVRVCIVTDELYPFTAGGIGRVVHNVLSDVINRGSRVELHLMFPGYLQVDVSSVQRYFGGKVHAHVAPLRQAGESAWGPNGLYPPPSAFTDSVWHAESLDVLRAFEALAEKGLNFDVIEFPDYRGLAFCLLQQKKLGLGFAQTTVSVRLHSSYGIIQSFDPNTLELENLGRYELERKAMLDADRVVAHLPAIAEFNRHFYGFDEAWAKKVVVEFPPAIYPVPVRIEGERPASSGRRDLVFLTKIQMFKRPDLFVRAAAMLMRMRPDFVGDAILICHSFWPEYEAEIRAIIPDELKARFHFRKPGPERDALMRGNIVVIPSDYESLNLTAYEASWAGARVVLNGNALAFGPDSPFVDGESCYKFDGTVEGLVSALERALDGADAMPVPIRVTPPFWAKSDLVEQRELTRPASAPGRISVVVVNQDEARYLPEALRSLSECSHPDLEVIVVDDASADAFDRHLLEHLDQEMTGDSSAVAQLIRSPVRRGMAAARNLGIAAATGEFVICLRPCHRLAVRFLETAVRALEHNHDFVGVVPTVGFFEGDQRLEAREFSRFGVFLGDAPSDMLVWNRIAPGPVVLRRRAVLEHGFEEKMHPHSEWDLYARMIAAGNRFIVGHDVQLYQPEPEQGGAHEPPGRRHYQLMARLLERLPRPLPSSINVAFTIVPLAVQRLSESAGIPAAVPSSDHARTSHANSQERSGEPLRYRAVDLLNQELKRLPDLHAWARHTAARARFNVAPDAPPLRRQLADTANAWVKQVLNPIQPALRRFGR